MVLARGLVDSPPDHSETLRTLRRIERRLRRAALSKPVVTSLHQTQNEASNDHNEQGEEEEEDEWEIGGDALSDDLSRPVDELWALLLDVVFSPLALRVRAASLLSVCFLARPEAPRVPRGHQSPRWLRSVVSSTCQALEELAPGRTQDAELLFSWLGFLEGVLVAVPSQQFAPLLTHSMYSGMLAKMVRLLGNCSTEVFAAATVCLAHCHAHEKRCLWLQPSAPSSGGPRLVLVGDVLARPAQDGDGRQHVGGALLHVINSCGCPCPDSRLVHLHNCLQLMGDILAHSEARELLFVNDFKVLVDVILRESTDLPPEHESRVEYLAALDRALAAPAFRESQLYRRRDILAMLEALLDDGAQEDSRLPHECVDTAQRLLLQYIDLLD